MYNVVALRRMIKKVPVGYSLKVSFFGGLALYNRNKEYVGCFCKKTSVFIPAPDKVQVGWIKIALPTALGLVVILSTWALQGCSFVKYTGEKSSLVGIELGTKTALQGLEHHRTADTFDISIETYSKDASAEAIAAEILKGVHK